MLLDVDAVDAAGEWLRHVPHSADPLARPDPPGDNRWQRGAVVDALYLADDEETLWAEWYRHLAEHGIPPLQSLPRDVWRFRVASLPVADLGHANNLERVGLPVPAPGRTSWPPYQGVGEKLAKEGWVGLLAPSAARPPGRVLCLFVDGGGVTSAKPVPPPSIVREPPAPPAEMRT